MLNKDGVKEYHGSNHTRDYLPDIITNRTLEFIEKAAVWRSLKVVADFVHVFFQNGGGTCKLIFLSRFCLSKYYNRQKRKHLIFL